MRDPTLERGNAYLAALRSACDAARREASEFPYAERIVSSLANWCRNVLFTPGWMEMRGERGGLEDLLTLCSDQSPMQALHCVPDAARREPLGSAFVGLMEGREDDGQRLPAWLFGKALAKGLVNELPTVNERSGSLLAEIRNLTHYRDLVQSAFEETLTEELHASPSARSAMFSLLESWVSDINANPGTGTYSIDRSSFCTLVDELRTNPSIDTVWKAREAPFPVHYDELEILPNILPTDRAAVLDRLDGFRFPEPLRQVLQHHAVLHDRDEIAAALTNAPTCCDDGRSWNGSLLALLLLQTAEDHCRSLWTAANRTAESDDADPKDVDRVGATLSSWFEDLGRIVMERHDGRFLGSQWLFMKVADERLERARHHHAGGQFDRVLRELDLIEWMAHGLFAAGLTYEDVDSLTSLPDIAALEPSAPARPSPLHDDPAPPRLAALSVLCLRGQLTGSATADEQRKVLDRLDALLASRDSGFESEFHLDTSGHGLPASCFGRLLAGEDRPAERWRRTWDLLVEQRRRGQHWSQTEDGDALAPSVFLLAVGLAGIDWLLSPSNNRRDAAGRLWREVFDGARDCWLTISLTHLRERFETCVGRLFARHPGVFLGSTGAATSSRTYAVGACESYGDRLAADLDLIGGNDRMLAVCCFNVAQNGASPAALDDVLSRNSGRLDFVLRQFEQWQQLEREVRRRPELVEALATLRQKMSGVVDERRNGQ